MTTLLVAHVVFGSMCWAYLSVKNRRYFDKADGLQILYGVLTCLVLGFFTPLFAWWMAKR